MGLWSSTSVNERIHKRWISYGEHEVLGNVTHLYLLIHGIDMHPCKRTDLIRLIAMYVP